MKPGAVRAGDRRLAEALDEAPRRRERLLAGVKARHDLDEPHHRHGREEVQADQPLLQLQGAGQLGDRDARCVRRQQRLRRDVTLEPGEAVALDLEVLDDRLDHELAVRQVRQLVHVGDPR
jgi:hypothetical protein